MKKNEYNYSWYVHGLWILGAVFIFLATMIAGNIEWVEGATMWSYVFSVIIALTLFLVGGVCWISCSVNSIKEEK